MNPADSTGFNPLEGSNQSHGRDNEMIRRVTGYNTQLSEDKRLIETEKSVNHLKISYEDQSVIIKDEEGIAQDVATSYFISDPKPLLESASKPGFKQKDEREEKKDYESYQEPHGKEVKQNSSAEILGLYKTSLAKQLNDIPKLGEPPEGANNEGRQGDEFDPVDQKILDFINQVKEASFEENFELYHKKHLFGSKEEGNTVITNLAEPKFSVYTFLKTSKLRTITKGNQGQLVFRYQSGENATDIVKVYTDKEVEAFMREKTVYSEISYDSQYYQINETKQTIYILVTKAGTGDLGDLFQYLRQERWRLNEQILLWCTASLLKSLIQLFVAGFCHRDIKPHNVIMINTYFGNTSLRLIDFGLAASIRQVNKSLRWAGSERYTDPYLLKKRTGYNEADLMLGDCYSSGLTILELVLTSLRQPLSGKITDMLIKLNADYASLVEILTVLLFPNRSQLQGSKQIIQYVQDIVSKIDTPTAPGDVEILFGCFWNCMILKHGGSTLYDDYCEVHDQKVQPASVCNEDLQRDFFEVCSKSVDLSQNIGYCISPDKIKTLRKPWDRLVDTNINMPAEFRTVVVGSYESSDRLIDRYEIPRKLIVLNNEGCRQYIFIKSVQEGYKQLTEAYLLISGRTLLKEYFENHIRNKVESFWVDYFEVMNCSFGQDSKNVYHLNCCHQISLEDFDLESVIIDNFYFLQVRYMVDQLTGNGNADILSELRRFASSCLIISTGPSNIKPPTDIMVQLCLIGFVSIIAKIDVEVFEDVELVELVKECKSLHQQSSILTTRFEGPDAWIWFSLVVSMLQLVHYLRDGLKTTLDDQYDFCLRTARNIPNFAQDLETIIDTMFCNYTAFSNTIYSLYVKVNNHPKSDNLIQLPDHLAILEGLYYRLEKIKLTLKLTSNGFDRSLTFSMIRFRPRTKIIRQDWYFLNEISKLQGLLELSIDLTVCEIPERCNQELTVNLSSLTLHKLHLISKSPLKDECMTLEEEIIASVGSVEILELELERNLINEEGVRRLQLCLQNLINLQTMELEFTYCPKITNEALIQLVDGVLECTKVENLYFSIKDCKLLSRDRLMDAKKKWSLLYPSKIIQLHVKRCWIQKASSYFLPDDQ